MTTDRYLKMMRFPYLLRHVPRENLVGLMDVPQSPAPGDIVLASINRAAKNSALELNGGPRCTLHEGDIIAAVSGKQAAKCCVTLQSTRPERHAAPHEI